MKYSIQLQRFSAMGFYQQIFGILAIYQPEDGYARLLMFIIALGKIR